MNMSLDRVAFRVGGAEIYWYGICVALAFLGGLAVLRWRARQYDLPDGKVADLLFPAIIGGVVGARILYVLTNFEKFKAAPLNAVKIWEGGLVFYGGFIGATAAVYWLTRRMNLSVGRVADCFAVALPVGQAIGRFGCLFNGCCFGKPTTSAFHVQYEYAGPIWQTQVEQGVILPSAMECLPVFPVQNVQTLLNLLVCGLLIWLATRVKRPGRLFALYLILYGTVRFLNEFNRGDYLTRFHGMTNAQVMSLAVIIPGGILLYWLIGRYSEEECADEATASAD
jgi:phosphatidylglycerol:prolipoprotein diacylglycerol transferase